MTHYTPNRRAEILTYGGEYFDFEDAGNDRGLDIETIAHALALTNRFGGHTKEPYSVAQHSVYVARNCDSQDALWGLLHDASEAYINDIVRPVKVTLPDYRWLEQKIMDRVADFYRLPFEIPESVHEADLVLCATEKRDLLPHGPDRDWHLPYPPLPETIVPWHWRRAKSTFLREYENLRKW